MSVTILDVAKTANFSAATVSRALHRPHMVDPSTRERICGVASTLGYTPNRMAQALVKRRTGTIAVVASDLANLSCPEVMRGAQRAAADRGLAALSLYGGSDAADELGLVHNVIGHVDGIVLCGSHLSDDQIRGIRNSTPLVVVGRDVPGFPSVRFDYSSGIRCAVDHLVALGHRTVCYVGRRSDRVARLLAQTVCEQAHVELIEVDVADANFYSGQGAAFSVTGCGATAVLAHNDVIAAGLINGLVAQGICVPGQISVVGRGDVPLAYMTCPALTTISVPRREAGIAAVEMLQLMITGADIQADVSPIPTGLVVRQSTGAAPLAP